MFAKTTVLLEKINNISEYLYSRQFTKSTGKLQGFFHHEAMLHGEMSGVRAPLGAVRRPKRASTFSLVKRFFFLPEKEMVQTPIISKIINIIWGHIQSKVI